MPLKIDRNNVLFLADCATEPRAAFTRAMNQVDFPYLHRESRISLGAHDTLVLFNLCCFAFYGKLDLMRPKISPSYDLRYLKTHFKS